MDAHRASSPAPFRRFTECLKAQGRHIVLTNERSGFPLYLPCPACSSTHGERELNDPKCAQREQAFEYSHFFE